MALFGKLISAMPFWKPIIAKIPKKALAGFQLALRQSEERADATIYLSNAINYSIASACIVFFLGIMLFPAQAAQFCAATLALTAAISIIYPYLLASQRQKQVECELGITLQSISLLLEFGQPFDNSLEQAPKGKCVERIFRTYFRRVEAGSSPIAVFESLSDEVRGAAWKRACSQLAFAYQNGGEGKYLENAAEELYSLQRQHHKKFAQRLSLLGLVFVAAACLIPALYGAYVLLSPLLEQQINTVDIYIAYLVAFPALCTCIVAAATFAAPPLPNFSDAYKKHGKKKTNVKELAMLAVASLACATALIVFPPFEAIKIPLALLGLFLPYGAKKAVEMVSESSRKANLEAGLPTSLLMASTYASSSIEQVPAAIARSKMGAASEAFAKAERLIKSGYSFEYALARVASGAKSALFSLSCTFISAAYRNGFETGPALQKISGYIQSTLEMRRELSSSLLVTKYTVLASAAFLVPFIIAILLKIVGTFPEAQNP
ncbi:MAG: type II secretion system F family protein, partial [Candidatus Micrarchaeia archaeon]